MMPGRNRPEHANVVDRLNHFRDQLAAAEAPSEGWPAAVRNALEPLQADETLSREPDLAEALGRLVLISEVGDCLDPEDVEGINTLRTFFLEAVDRLTESLTQGNPEEAMAWIIQESDEHWGAYLAIIDPSVVGGGSTEEPEPELLPEPDPIPQAEQGGFDAAALIRSLTGMIDETPSEPEAPTEPPSFRPLEPSNSETPSPPIGPQPAPAVPPSPSDPAAEVAALELDPELRTILIADLTDLLARIQDLVLRIGHGDDSQTLHELGRCYHTMKGASGSVGLTTLATRIHELEDAIEGGGGSAEGPLIGRLEESLSWIETTLDALRGSERTTPSEPTGAITPDEPGPLHTSPEPIASDESLTDGDGLIRMPVARFEELMDLCSELLTRRRVWSEQADRMKQLAHSGRQCSQRLRGSVDRLEEALPVDAVRCTSIPSPSEDELAVQVRRMMEQAEDLAVLAATAREAAVPMASEAEDLSRLSLRLWDGLQSIRIVPVRGVFQRLIRVARDAARIEGRTIDVTLIGEDTGADRVMLDKAYEPLLHVVRNAVGHGIETPDERQSAGKAPEGRITLEARREGNTVVLEVTDDGRGLDYEAIAEKGRRLGLIGPHEQPSAERLSALIFHSGFSTRSQANSVSGRGVGMDVVAREVEALRGRVELTSQPGRGTRLAIRLPARIALEHMMVIRIRGQAFAVPTSAIDAVHRASAIEPASQGNGPIARIDDRRLPLIDLGPVLGFSGPSRESCPIVLVVTSEMRAVALQVDGIDGPQELVLKPLGSLLAGNPAISGAGLSTGGEVIPALDVAGLLRLAREGDAPIAFDPDPVGQQPVALVVDDSLSVRRIASRHLRALGFIPEEASDGEEALGKLRTHRFDLVMTDLEMPRMDGFALLAELRRTGVLESSRVIVTSTLSDPATRRRVFELGAAAFVPKPVDPEELAAAVGPVIHHRTLGSVSPGVVTESPNLSA
ncbi:hybrid sensor histidine kinase/response regulator [Tautonia marina]|uniref:hybrid sensor histidine kinase/response regulator n=1 Tax=Tautonia marina TaxID=2653855 RepID=UPI0012609FC5|nr:response regulator [Tautonia marina]